MRRVSPKADAFRPDSLGRRPSTSGIPEDDDLTMSSDGAASGLEPPARVAARFYRPTNSRRRSSAASSRRNSMSSAHSHHSHHSHHSYHGPQSGHVAQHLRRASILESRKARLADRAAHAEKVRLRAAMAKAAPRPSNSEERALAAQQARERYLAGVTAACAEEVKRAKRVAEDMKERREAEGRKLRGEMEEKLAEAEKRRVEYKRNGKRGRTLSLPRVDEKKVVAHAVALTRAEAASRVQATWRRHRRRQTIRRFAALGLTVERVRGAEFADVGELLSREDVLASTAEVLALCGLRDGEGGPIEERAAVRTFLSAYLVLGHPAQVLSSDGEQERDLTAKSEELLMCFDRLLSRCTPSNGYVPPPALSRALSEAHRTFCAAFAAWKAHDSSTLVQTMIAQYVELDTIWQKIKDDTEEFVKAEYRDGIRNNQVLLMVRIKRLAGPDRAKAMMRDAIRGARRGRAKRPAGDARPRAAAAEVSGPLDVAPAATQALDSRLPDLRAPAHDVRDSRQADGLTRVMSTMPDNRALVHELAINKDYRIPAASLLQSEPRRRLCAAVFDGMRRDVQAGQGDRWIVAMAETIRARLLRLLTPGNSLHTLISEALDPAMIERECAMGSFSYERFFSFMLSILPRLCAPFRDGDVRRLAADQDGDVIDRLARLLQVIDLLSLDFANYILQQNAARLIGQAAGYEQRRFEEDLASGALTLERTRRWWAGARDKVVAEAGRRDPDGVNHPANAPTPEKIYLQGLNELAMGTTELDAAGLPETLGLDAERLGRMRADTLRMVTTGAILLTAKNLLKRDVRAQWRGEATKVWELLSSPPGRPAAVAASILSTIEAAHALPAASRAHLSSAVSRFLAQAAAPRPPTDPVMKLLHHRLRAHMHARLGARSAGERVRVASTASEALARSGLPEFVGRVGAMAEELGRVGEVDRAAHGRWYDGLGA
ncbi:MAG: hypothetical protein M1832_000109 [Thelocarpon impressellum]|nr:MAG: hypothetical protein M1832_000109 [Thelocarpon impressellum]